MARNANWLDCVCVIHVLHMCQEARVEFEYVCQLISILFFRQDLKSGAQCADGFLEWWVLETVQAHHLQCWEYRINYYTHFSFSNLCVVNRAKILILGGKHCITEPTLEPWI